MKITCNSLLEAPVINLVKLYDSLNVKGVCGILTPGSKHNVEHTTVGALSLLSYCNELVVADSFNSKLKLIDITLERGGINYFAIANASGSILSVPEHLSAEPFAMSTNPVRFKLLVGVTTAEEPLTEEDVYTFVSENNTKGYEFTAVPLPLLSKKLLKFNTTIANGKSTIECEGVSENILNEILTSLSQQK